MAQSDIDAHRVDLGILSRGTGTDDTSVVIQEMRGSGSLAVPAQVSANGRTETQGLSSSLSPPERAFKPYSPEVNQDHSSPASSNEYKTSDQGVQRWRTTLLHFGPLSGLACMMLAVLSILVSLGILLGSQDASATSWSVEPSAILAICTAVANQAMRFAAFQGAMVAWWSGGS